MKIFPALCGLLGGVMLAASAAFAETTMVLAETAKVADEYIMFADLATITGDNALLIKRHFIAPMPESGTKTFTRDDLRARLQFLGLERGVIIAGSEKTTVFRDRTPRQTLPESPSAAPLESRDNRAPIKVSAPKNSDDAAPVRRALAQIAPSRESRQPAERLDKRSVDPRTEKQLRDSLGKLISAEFAGIDSRAQINIRRVVLAHKDYASLEISGVREGRIPGRVVVNLIAYDRDGNALDYGSAETQIEIELATLVLARSLNKGDLVSDGDIVVQYERYSGVRPEKLTLADVRGRECQKMIRAGTRLAMADFAAPEVVKKGDEVIVRAGAAGFRVEERTTAANSGKVGDFVMVQGGQGKNTYSYKVRLTGRGTAELAR